MFKRDLRAGFGWAALAVLLAGCAAIVAVAAAGPSTLVEGSAEWSTFPGWVAGPLHGLRASLSPRLVGSGFSGVMVVMTAAYVVVLRCAGSLPARAIAGFAAAAAAILLLGPPLQMTDLFNYLGYSRLWVVHGLNPYTHVIAEEWRDPVYGFTSWRNWHSPYGSLFTLLTYPVGLLGVGAAVWTLKAVTVIASLALLWLVWRCARLLGRDPRLPVLILAANPLYLIYAVGEFHNDFFMLVPALAAVALLLAGRHRAAGVAVALAVAVKLTMVLLVPFLLVGAARQRASRRVAAGLALTGLPLAGLSLLVFGPTLPNVAGQSRLLTGLSIPNLLGWAIGLGGGTPALVRDMNAAIVAVAGYQLLRRREWLAGAGWATLALLASLGWLMPWYLVWLLPFAALASSPRLRRVASAATVFLVVSFLPVTGGVLSRLELNPTAGAVGLAAWNYQWVSQFGRPRVSYALVDAQKSRRPARRSSAPGRVRW